MCKVSITLEWEGWYRVDGQWCINVALGFAKNVHLRWPKKRGRRLLHEQSLQFHLPNHNGGKPFLKKYPYFYDFQNIIVLQFQSNPGTLAPWLSQAILLANQFRNQKWSKEGT